MPSFLYVGCGQKRKDKTTQCFMTEVWNELRYDIDPSVEPDLTATMTNMDAIANGYR